MKKMLSGLLALVLLSGCIGDEFNTDLLVDDVDVNAGIAIPLVKSSVTMEDILSDQTDMVKYDGENIILFQENDSMEYVGINDFFRLSTTTVSLDVPFILFNTQSSYSAAEKIKFSIPDAEISLMDLNYQVAASGANLQAPLKLTITLPTENNGGTERSIILEVHNNQTTTQAYAGDRFSLSNNELDMQVTIEPLYDGAMYDGTVGTVELQFGEFSLSYVKGRMTENQVTMDEGSYALDFDVLNDIPGEVEFADPKLSIIVDNATPFAGEVHANLSGTEDGTPIALTSLPFNIEGTIAGESSARTRYVLNKDNSNIASFISKTPELLNYAGLLTLNPGGAYSQELELTDEDRIYIGYGFEVPLDLRLNAELDEEIVDLGDMDVLDDLTKGAIVITSVNSLPIGASAIIHFYDTQTASIIETMDIDMVKPAIVDANGKVTEAVQNVMQVVLTESQIESLKEAEELRVSIRLNTTDYDKGQTVVFQRQNALELQLSIRGKIEYKN